MFRPSTLLVLLLGLAPAAGAATLQEAEQASAAARQEVSALRSRQQATRGELSTVARQIEAAKSARAGEAAVLPAGELQRLLQRSQELSQQLTGLAQQLASGEEKARTADEALLGALNAELEQLRGRASTADRAERPAVLARLRVLREQQARVTARLPAASVPTVSTRASDDPEELLEQADALRDGEDKLRARLQQVQQRLEQARAARDLDRRMGDFSRDDALFDDSDRRFRMRRDIVSDAPARGNPTAPQAGGAEMANSAAAPGAAGATGADAVPTAPSSPSTPTTTTVTAKDSLPQVGRPQAAPGAFADEDVAVLEAEAKRLKRQADDLSSRAGELEKKAAALGGR
jgi:uncharacterized protein YukE